MRHWLTQSELNIADTATEFVYKDLSLSVCIVRNCSESPVGLGNVNVQDFAS